MLTLRIDCIPNPPPSAPNSFTWDLACAYAHERLCNLDDDTVEMQAVVTECYERACKLNDAGVVWGLGFGVWGLWFMRDISTVCEKEVFRMCHVMVKDRW